MPVADGVRLAVRRVEGTERPFLLVHGLASNARLWAGVGRRLAAAGHEVVAVDLRGHGASDQPVDGYTTKQCADDLATLCAAVGLVGGRAPIAAGQSWGGNVVVSLAVRHAGVAGLALVDGGWIALGERFATFEECWRVLAPPRFTLPYAGLAEQVRLWHPGWPAESIAGTVANFRATSNGDGMAVARLAREHHRHILRSLWEDDPRPSFARIAVPVLVAPAVPSDADDARRAGPCAAMDLLPDATVSWYLDADHDLHAQQPARLAGDLLALAARVGGDRGPG